MRKTFVWITVLALLLAACASPSNQAPAQPAPATPVPATAVPPTAVLPTSIAPEAATATQPAPATATPGTDSSNTSAATGMMTFTIDDSQSQVSYQVGEVFINDNNRFNTAIGVTQGINGQIVVDPADPQKSQMGPITVDISQFKSDSGRRDSFIRGRFLESSKYPLATFTPTGLEGLPGTIQNGQDYTLKINGDLTVKDTTKPVSFDTTVRLDGNKLTGQASTSLLMSDFGVGPIDLAGILKTEDQVKIQFDFVALPAASQ